jgi:hypothetical protein
LLGHFRPVAGQPAQQALAIAGGGCRLGRLRLWKISFGLVYLQRLRLGRERLIKIRLGKNSLKGVSLGGAGCWGGSWGGCWGGGWFGGWFGRRPKGRLQGRQIWQRALQLARIEGHTSEHRRHGPQPHCRGAGGASRDQGLGEGSTGLLQPGQKPLQQSIEATEPQVPGLRVCGLEGCGSSAIEAINLHISSIEQPLEPQQSEHKRQCSS